MSRGSGDNVSQLAGIDAGDVSNTIDNIILPDALQQLKPEERLWFDGLGDNDADRWAVANDALSNEETKENVPAPIASAINQARDKFQRTEQARDEFSFLHAVPAYAAANPYTMVRRTSST